MAEFYWWLTVLGLLGLAVMLTWWRRVGRQLSPDAARLPDGQATAEKQRHLEEAARLAERMKDARR